LQFTTSYADAADFGDVHFLCVGTPQEADGSPDLRQVNAAADALARHLSGPCLVVGKSTVPVGTARSLGARISELAPAGLQAELAWNPEFLREGFAVRDSLAPDRLVFGVTSERSERILRQVYAAPLDGGVPGLFMDLETAELTKVSANAFLATKISFINAMAEVCEKAGADVARLAEALAHDQRIGGRFLVPGLGFGGGCLPKDIRAFRSTARALGVESVASLLGEVDTINTGRRARVVELAREAVGGTLAERRVAVLGLSFKPGSDDVRDSPSLAVCALLRSEGALVSAHDPVAIRNAARVQPDIRYASSVMDAAVGADVILHLTEWHDYRVIDPAMLREVVAQRILIDARGALDEDLWRSAGWSFRVLGRP
jgi:UDPglucose 6-dehydrogenase